MPGAGIAEDPASEFTIRELVDRLTFERWVELDIIARSLAMQEQVIGKLQPRDKPPVHHPAT